MDIQDAKKQKEMADFLKAYTELAWQRQNPDRNGMIDALKDALKVGWSEIKTVEASRGETMLIPWEQIPNDILYAKLTEYQQGLLNHALNEFGKEYINQLLQNQS